MPVRKWNAAILEANCAQVLSETEKQLRVFSESILTTTVLEKSCRIPYVDPATVKETSKQNMEWEPFAR